jgi:hypothetical protein
MQQYIGFDNAMSWKDEPKRGRGRPRKPLSDLRNPPKGCKNGLEWGLAALNDPGLDLRIKASVLAAVLRYEAARDFGPVAANAAAGKKEQRAQAAKAAATDAYAPPPQPPMPKFAS